MTAEWITPLEASLEISIRKGHFVSPDDLKQLRNKGKIDKQYLLRVSNEITLYKRDFIVSDLPAPNKRTKQDAPVEYVAKWLEEYPETIVALMRDGFVIPNLEEANTKVAQKKRERKLAKENA